MATESNQQAGATGPAAPPATPTRNRHSAGIQVSLLNGAVLELTPKEVDGLGLPTYTSCNEWPPIVSPSGAAIRTFQETLQTADEPEPYDERESNP